MSRAQRQKERKLAQISLIIVFGKYLSIYLSNFISIYLSIFLYLSIYLDLENLVTQRKARILGRWKENEVEFQWLKDIIQSEFILSNKQFCP